MKASDEVLEIGCGTGILAEQVAQKLSSGKVIAIDKSEAMLRMTTQQNRELFSKAKCAIRN